MSSKMVRLSEQVYQWIEDQKKEDETFSDAVERLVKRPSLQVLSGMLSDEEVEAAREAIRASQSEDIQREQELIDHISEGGET